jgi:hypothetical protein
MEPVSLILQALVAGAQAATTDAIKSGYNKLKALIQQKWVGKPDAETMLNGYEEVVLNGREKDREAWENLLKEKLRESSIHEDQQIRQEAERLLESSIRITGSQVALKNQHQQVFNVDQKKQTSATDKATISQDTISANGDAIKVGRDFTQKTIEKQTRLAALLWLLALALTGVIGFGVYLFMTGRLQLPGQPAFPERGINSEQLPAATEQRVSLIQGGMTFAQVEEKLGVHLKLYSEISHANTPFGSMYARMNMKGEAIYSCVLEDGSPFYFGFIQTVQPDRLVLVRKAATPWDLTPPR